MISPAAQQLTACVLQSLSWLSWEMKEAMNSKLAWWFFAWCPLTSFGGKFSCHFWWRDVGLEIGANLAPAIYVVWCACFVGLSMSSLALKSHHHKWKPLMGKKSLTQYHLHRLYHFICAWAVNRGLQHVAAAVVQLSLLKLEASRQQQVGLQFQF